MDDWKSEIPPISELMYSGSNAKIKFHIRSQRFWIDWGGTGWSYDILPRISLILWSDDHDIMLSWLNWFVSFSWEP